MSNSSSKAAKDKPIKSGEGAPLLADVERSASFGSIEQSFHSLRSFLLSASERDNALRKPGVGEAAFLIRDALLGLVNDFEKVYDPYQQHGRGYVDTAAIICGRLSAHKMVVRLVYAAMWGVALLTFVEPPHWCRDDTGESGFSSCQQVLSMKGPSIDGDEIVDYYPNSNSMWLTVGQSIIAESILLSVVFCYFLLRFGRNGFDPSIFFQKGPTLPIRLLQCISFVGLYTGLITGMTQFNPFLRLTLLGTFHRSFHREFRTLLDMLPQILYILSVLAIVIFFYAWFGTVIFYGTAQGERDFSNLVESLWTLWQMTTTVNYPDVMMPSYNENRLAGIYFVSFMTITFFFIMNLCLAAVVNAYDKAIEDRKASRAALTKNNLTKAFELMDPQKSGRIDRDSIMALFCILNEDFPEFHYLSKDEANILFGFLDRDGSSEITLEEFLDFGNVLLIQLTKASDYQTMVEIHFPDLFKSNAYQSFCRFVNSQFFDYGVDVVLLLNAAVIAVQSYPELAGLPVEIDPQLRDGELDTIWEGFETLFTLLYVIEVLVKVTVFGWKKYTESSRNMFDFVITICSVAATAYVYYPNGYYDSRLIRLIVMARVLRLVRLLFAIKQFQLIGQISADILPAAASVLLFLFFLMYLFSALGVALYGGLITRDPSNRLSLLLADSDFGENDYWANNFNDMISGMNVLFNLLVINNWTTCELGFEAVTEAKWVRYFFFFFHVLGVILVNNLVVAFVINAFFQQLETLHYATDEEVVDGEAVIRFQQATFDASRVTGTNTGASGNYIATLKAIHRDIELDERQKLRMLFTRTSSTADSQQNNQMSPTSD